MTIQQRLDEMGITLPSPPKAAGSYVTVKRTENLLFTSGASCFEKGRFKYQGKVGKELTLAEGGDAARITVLNLLSQIKAEIGSLDKVKGIVKLLGFVNSSDDFYEQHVVMNAASDLLAEIFGDSGKHARSAIGVNALPLNVPIEIEIVLELKE